MQREIKFRGKRFVNDPGWIEGNLVKHIRGTYQIITFDSYDEWDVLPETVGQYTGLKDKNGVEIWEGDIITHDVEEGLGEPKLHNQKQTVEFYRDNSHSITYWHTNIRIIGNIHDHKDLIK